LEAKQSRGDVRQWIIPLLLTCSALLIAVAGSELATLLRYQRTEIGNGEWWRLLSGHLVHLSWAHLWMNLAGLVLVWLLVGRTLTLSQWVYLIGLCAIGISLGLFWWMPRLDWYVGLSGLLHGMLFAAALSQALRGDRESMVIIAVMVLKVGYEMWQGPLPGSREAAGGEVVYQAHAMGCLCATLFVMAQQLHRRIRV